MNEIILLGAGGHARSCIDVIEVMDKFKVAGLIERDDITSQKIIGYPIIGTNDNLLELRKEYNFAFISIGQLKSAGTRIKLFQLLKEIGYILPIIISPRAYVSKHAQIGEGTIIMHDAIVNANARIGKNCIINNKALIEHDVIIGDDCHIATGAIINGEVTVGKESFIGSGVVTKHCISIHNNCVIGSGVILKNDTLANQVIKN